MSSGVPAEKSYLALREVTAESQALLATLISEGISSLEPIIIKSFSYYRARRTGLQPGALIHLMQRPPKVTPPAPGQALPRRCGELRKTGCLSRGLGLLSAL